jgi:TfoX/Sxy family transcriptional regulator of competence genes
MPARKKSPATNPKIEQYEKLLASIPGLERKGDANPYTAINGNMFTLLHQSERVAIRLPEDKRQKFLKKYKTKLFEAYGAVMREYVAVPDAMLKDPKDLKKYFAFSYAYAKTLRPKPTKKKS